MPPLAASLRAAYDPARFRADGHRLIDRLADHLVAAEGRDDAPVLPWVEPAAAQAAWPDDLPDRGDDDLVDVLTRIAAGSIRLHHPRYLGHQVPPPLPGAALADLVAALLNNGMAVYEMGPTATPMELAAVRWMARQLGLPAGAGGVLTSGGSLGNLTALLAARQARAGFDAWAAGDHGGPPLAILGSTQAHYSLARAVRIMGWGDGGVVPVEVDARWRLRPDALDAAWTRAADAGRRVVAVVASAGATGTGAYDPLAEIAAWCAERGVWLHVDGAHGAAAALSPRHRHLVAGIERADSVVWDAHKLLALPALVTAVIFRDERRSYQAFAQEASYLYAAGDGDRDAAHAEWFNLGLRTLECTKRMLSVMLYGVLAAHGPGLFRDYVERVFALGAALAARIDAAPDFELVTPPDGNIVCWRWRPAGGPPPGPELDALQARVRRAVLVRGRYYLLQTRLPVGVVLRAALMNPLADERELDGVLDEIRAVAAV
ncbi:MAG: pyridoxal-dependent decarboxylase [Kofleriaceae bacterium]|nr:pyridoxal-dependent decarboxylase [Kofleriaceae bacterium]MCB9571938.1 pyridoxal-dependent decarboxylase [Kofleriaceae bacterium]